MMIDKYNYAVVRSKSKPRSQTLEVDPQSEGVPPWRDALAAAAIESSDRRGAYIGVVVKLFSGRKHDRCRGIVGFGSL